MRLPSDPDAARVHAEFRRGYALHQEGRLAEAQQIYGQVLAAQPRHFDALHLLGLIAYQTGNSPRAVELIGAAIDLNPDVAAAHSNLGLALHKLRRLESALDSYERALRLRPDYAEAYRNRGTAQQELDRLEEALQSYDRALALEPDHAATHSNRGNVLRKLSRRVEALQSHDRALSLNPDLAEVHSNRGSTLQDLGRLAEALVSYDRAVVLQPDLAEAHLGRGNTLRKLGRLDEALDGFDRALSLKPDFAQVHAMRGNTLQALSRHAEALGSYDRALSLEPDQPEAHSNRGSVLQALGRLREALDGYDRALALKPDYAQAHSNRGSALQEQGRFNEALHSYDRALALVPDLAEAQLNLSLCRLLQGDFARGWEGYEWRWRSAQMESRFGAAQIFAQPLWLGERSLQGKTILLHGEQGLGDTLQFCRYAKMVSGLGARVILQAPAPLVALLRSLAGVAQVVETGIAPPAFDFHCPLLSLPLAFKTDASTVPSSERYLAADSGRLADWKARLGKQTRPRVGLAWSGSSAHANDRNRSIALTDLIAGLSPGYQYISLQKEPRDADRRTLGTRPDILTFEEHLADFADTAALCELVDVVVSVDTSVAHLAGALGKPAWILLPFVPDWRWLLDRDDSPWYSSARLFRQDRVGDWSGVLEKVRGELQRRFGILA